ncbi:hypothetical protein BDF21DRAFT_419910 [Thamnidium elegans]|nr:hypothetical protein BDF21DRAFT_419910 [Thamnidium elegans]
MLCCFGSENAVCTFCNYKETIGSRVVAQTETCVAFHDRSPSAQLHLLVISKNHIRTIKDLDAGDVPLLQEMIDLGKTLLKEQGFNPDDDSQIR